MRLMNRLMLYSFGGWLIEEIYQLVLTGSFGKPNFLLGPFKPMYGIAAVLLLAVKPLGKKAFFFFAQAIPLGVEYLSGIWLKYAFGLQYWDYSEYRYNIDGLVCMKFALAWVGLSYLFAYGLQPKLAERKITLQNSGKCMLGLLQLEYLADICYAVIWRWGGMIG